MGRSLAIGLVVGLLASVLWEGRARAQALRRFEDAHTQRPPSNPSSTGVAPTRFAGPEASGSSGDGVGELVGWALARAILGTAEVIADAVDDAPPADEATPIRRFPARVIYDGDRASAYVEPHRRLELGKFERVAYPRRGELTLGGFLAVNEQVYAHDAALRGWLGLFVVHASWERFYEPSAPTSSIDTLDIFRLHAGPNLLGPHVDSLELYPLFGASGLHGAHGITPAFDLGIEGRAYPLRPLAFFASTTASVFADGPPLFDARLEAGISLGRFEVRAGLRMLKQEPSQSFLGPVASFVVRM